MSQNFAVNTINLSGDVIGTSTASNVISVNGVFFPANPPVNSVPVVMGTNSVTYQSLTDAQISSGAAIAGTKISPNFGSQNVSTAGTLASGTHTITGGLTLSSGAVSLTANSASTFTTSSGAITITAAGASTWSSAAALTISSGAAATWSTSSGALTVDSAAALNLGTSTATSVAIGKSGVTTTVTGGLSQAIGAINLTANAASQFTTSAGALTIDATAAALNLGNTNATSIVIGNTANTTSITINGTTGSTISLIPPTMQWGAAVSSPIIKQTNNATTLGQALTIQAQNAGGTNQTGGNLSLQSGTKTGSGFDGYVLLSPGGTTQAFVSSALSTGIMSAGGLGIGATPGTSPTISSGTGVPATTQPNGSIFLRTDGTSATGLYVREAAAWTALSGGGGGTSALSAPITATPVNTNTATTYTIDTTGGGSDFLILHNKSGAASYIMPAPTNGRFLEFQDITGAIQTTANNVFLVPHAGEKLNTSTGFSLTGTAFTINNGSTSLTATGSKFQSELASGMSLIISGQANTNYIVSSIASDTSLTLTANFTGTNTSTSTGLRTSLTWAANFGRLFIRTNGTDWFVKGDGTPTQLTYTSSSGGSVPRVVWPAGVTLAYIDGCGGGGGGGGGGNGAGTTGGAGGAGGGGADRRSLWVTVSSNTAADVIIGAGGSAGASGGGGAAGGDAGASSVGSLVSFIGASGGNGGGNGSTTGPNGGTPWAVGSTNNTVAVGSIGVYISNISTDGSPVSLGNGGKGGKGTTGSTAGKGSGGSPSAYFTAGVGASAGTFSVTNGSGAGGGGGGGGGFGAGAAGGTGGNTGASGTTGSTAAANSGGGAGGGGGGGGTAGTGAAGGAGAAGQILITYVL